MSRRRKRGQPWRREQAESRSSVNRFDYPTEGSWPRLSRGAKARLLSLMEYMRHRHLPRLLPDAYRGRQFVHWIMALKDRRTGWLTAQFHDVFREILMAEARYSVVVPTYCLMPDHLHLISVGVSSDADQRLWVRAVRRQINCQLAPWQLQKQAFDHVLRPAENGRDAFTVLVHYVLENPVRAGLAIEATAWPYSGACVPMLSGLDPRRTDFAERWWHYWSQVVTKVT